MIDWGTARIFVADQTRRINASFEALLDIVEGKDPA
jgi:hypothetical protein